MESLLRWGIENSDPNAAITPSQRLKDLDPGIIDMILGKPDSVLMKVWPRVNGFYSDRCRQ